MLVPFRDIDDKRILQSDWMGDLTEHTQPKKLVSGATFPGWLPKCEKSKISIDSIQRHW